MSGAQIGNDQGILPQLTLGMAAADPHNRGHQRLEAADRVFVVAFGERSNAVTKLDGGGTRGELAVGVPSFHLRQSGCQHPAAGCRCDQGVMDIGKVRTSLREEPIAKSGDFLPIGLQACLAGERKSPH